MHQKVIGCAVCKKQKSLGALKPLVFLLDEYYTPEKTNCDFDDKR